MCIGQNMSTKRSETMNNTRRENAYTLKHEYQAKQSIDNNQSKSVYTCIHENMNKKRSPKKKQKKNTPKNPNNQKSNTYFACFCI